MKQITFARDNDIAESIQNDVLSVSEACRRMSATVAGLDLSLYQLRKLRTSEINTRKYPDLFGKPDPETIDEYDNMIESLEAMRAAILKVREAAFKAALNMAYTQGLDGIDGLLEKKEQNENDPN